MTCKLQTGRTNADDENEDTSQYKKKITGKKNADNEIENIHKNNNKIIQLISSMESVKGDDEEDEKQFPSNKSVEIQPAASGPALPSGLTDRLLAQGIAFSKHLLEECACQFICN